MGGRNTAISIGVNPHMYDPPYAVWSIWQSCGWLYRVVLILIGGLTVYSLPLSVVTLVRLRRISADKSDVSLDLSKKSVQALYKHWVNIRQATIAVFCIFGLVLFFALQYVGITFGDGKQDWTGQILNNFTLAGCKRAY